MCNYCALINQKNVFEELFTYSTLLNKFILLVS